MNNIKNIFSSILDMQEKITKTGDKKYECLLQQKRRIKRKSK